MGDLPIHREAQQCPYLQYYVTYYCNNTYSAVLHHRLWLLIYGLSTARDEGEFGHHTMISSSSLFLLLVYVISALGNTEIVNFAATEERNVELAFVQNWSAQNH